MPAIPQLYRVDGGRQPGIVAPATEAAIWAGNGYSGTTDSQSSSKFGALLLNPLASTATLHVFAVLVSTAVTGTVRLAYTSVTTGYTQSTKVAALQAQSGSSAPAGQGQVWYELAASDPATFFAAYTSGSNITLPPVILRPNSGLLVVADAPTTAAVTFQWLEYQVT